MPVVMRHSHLTVVPPLPAGTPGAWPKLSDTGTTGPLTPWTASHGLGTPYNGATIENALFTDTVGLYGSNITLRNCRIETFQRWGVLQQPGSVDCRLEYCHVDGGGVVNTTGVGMGQGTAAPLRPDLPGPAIIGCNIEGVTLGINNFGPNLVYGNYIHNLWSSSEDAATRHFDGMIVFGTGGQILENNTVIMPDPDGGTGAIFLANRYGGNIQNVLIKNNLLMGKCAYTVYLEDAQGLTVTGVTIRDNYIEFGDFGHVLYPAERPTEISNVKWNAGEDDIDQYGVTWPTYIPPEVHAWNAKT